LLSPEALFSPKCCLAAGLHPDLLGELKCSPDLMAVAMGRDANKEREG